MPRPIQGVAYDDGLGIADVARLGASFSDGLGGSSGIAGCLSLRKGLGHGV